MREPPVPAVMTNRPKFAVVHSMHLWLAKTMTWLHTQVTALPQHIESHIVCDRTLNLDQFREGRLVSADADSWLWRHLAARSWSIARHRKRYLLESQLQRCGASILHSHFGDRGWENIGTARRRGTRHVVSFYGYDVGRLPQNDARWRDRYSELFETADIFLCEGPHLASELVALGCPPNKAKVHHLGINLDRVEFKPRQWQPGTTLRVLLSGTFTEKKGLPYAVAALGLVAGRADIEVLIVGDAGPRPDRQHEKGRILEAIRTSALGPRTHLLGYQSHEGLLRAAAGCHLFVSPSVRAADGDTEGGAPVTIIEMAASGMPVVSTTHCDIPEVLEDGVSGLLAPERDVSALAERITYLLDHPERWSAMAHAARSRIEAEFDSVLQGQRLASIYESLCAG